MQNVQRSWKAVATDANRALDECDLSAKELSDKAKIDYYAARRILHRGITNRSKSAIQVCNHFGIALGKSPKVQNDLYQLLADTIQDTWDGSEPHAELIKELIRSTKHFKVEDRH